VAGYPETADVRIARHLSGLAGVEHRVRVPPPTQSLEALEALNAVSPGFFSLSSISTAELPIWTGAEELEPALPILFSGAGGEIARAYYGVPASGGLSARQLQRKLLKSYPPPVLNRTGRRRFLGNIDRWITGRLGEGLPEPLVPEALYMLERMSNWAGPLHATSEYFRDVTSPLWTAGVVEHMVAAPAAERAVGGYHAAMVDHLAPELAAEAYEGASYGGGRAATLRKVAGTVAKEAGRRYGRRGEGGDTGDVLPQALALLRPALDRTPRDHPARSLLTERRVDRLLARDPERVDPRTREQIWRLVTVFVAGTTDGPGQAR
jgi:hypothetical protein